MWKKGKSSCSKVLKYLFSPIKTFEYEMKEISIVFSGSKKCLLRYKNDV